MITRGITMHMMRCFLLLLGLRPSVEVRFDFCLSAAAPAEPLPGSGGVDCFLPLLLPLPSYVDTPSRCHSKWTAVQPQQQQARCKVGTPLSSSFFWRNGAQCDSCPQQSVVHNHHD